MLGKLKLAEDAEPISAAEASSLIAAAAESQASDAGRAATRTCQHSRRARMRTKAPPLPRKPTRGFDKSP
jgi:hypothetical protein